MIRSDLPRSKHSPIQSQSMARSTSVVDSAQHLSLGQLAKKSGVSKAEAKRIMKYQKACHLAKERSYLARKLQISKLDKPDYLTSKQTTTKQQNMSGQESGALDSLGTIREKKGEPKLLKNPKYSDQVLRPGKRNLPINSRSSLFINHINYKAPTHSPEDIPHQSASDYPYTRSSSHVSSLPVLQTQTKCAPQDSQISHNTLNVQHLRFQISYLSRLRLKMQENIFLLFRRIESEMNQSLAAPALTMIVLGQLVAVQTAKVAKISVYLEGLVLGLKKLRSQ